MQTNLTPRRTSKQTITLMLPPLIKLTQQPGREAVNNSSNMHLATCEKKANELK
jgi:hypothetical protein